MDRQTATKLRYDRLKQTLADQGEVKARGRRARLLAIAFVGMWAMVPAILWDVELESVARPEFFRTPTAHEAYLLRLVGAEATGPGRPGPSARERAWAAAGYRALDAPLSVGPSYREVGLFPPDDPQALGLTVHIPAGQRLRLRLESQAGRSASVFVDLFRAAPDSLQGGGARCGPSAGLPS